MHHCCLYYSDQCVFRSRIKTIWHEKLRVECVRLCVVYVRVRMCLCVRCGVRHKGRGRTGRGEGGRMSMLSTRVMEYVIKVVLFRIQPLGKQSKREYQLQLKRHVNIWSSC